jgi:hypothetical protein
MMVLELTNQSAAAADAVVAGVAEAALDGWTGADVARTIGVNDGLDAAPLVPALVA